MKRFTFTTPLALLIMLASMLTFSGCIVDTCTTCNQPPPCTYGPDGYAGPAFFGMDWAVHQPNYVWTNNGAIPGVFRYSTYYNSLPGDFNLYYEGSYLNGCCMVDYHWDVNFTVWINGGAAGGCGYAGADGLPSYLMLVMGPNGPDESRTNKMSQAGVQVDILSATDTEYIIQLVKGDINVRVKYTKLENSRKAELDPSGIRIAE
ncbi:MAG TPA: hypothetical protein ENJ82_09835 [Bacteroidetes bacterium]|nr:hypothetical protein [Bacteroidota bacterium]